MSLALVRTHPVGMGNTTHMNATVVFRDGHNGGPVMNDLSFSMRTYEKINKEDLKADLNNQKGDQILKPINVFLDTLSQAEHQQLYDMFSYAKKSIGMLKELGRREVQDNLQQKIYDTVRKLRLADRLIEFCGSPYFTYPPLAEAGTKAHHTPEKTFREQDYIEITAISLLSKLMVPIWGEFIDELRENDVSNNQREKIAFDLIEPTLEDSSFERVYAKLTALLESLVKDKRNHTDKKAALSATNSSFIITHNGIDDQMFDMIVMSTIVVKRLAIYECFERKDGNLPNAMVYIDDSIKRTADTRIQDMRSTMAHMPRRELGSHESEDNQSVIDHASRTSKKPIDVPVFVETAVGEWDLPRLVEELNVDKSLYESSADYYLTHGFPVSPLCQAMVASFIGTRFGGSKCLNYLSPKLYQRVVVLLQIFLIKQGMLDLAQLIVALSSDEPIDGPINPMGARIRANLRNPEYDRCLAKFTGQLDKPVVSFGKKRQSRMEQPEHIDFENTIKRMIEWLVQYSHKQNMAPAMWAFANVSDRPVHGSDVVFSDQTIQNLCRFYLIFHDGPRPFK